MDKFALEDSGSDSGWEPMTMSESIMKIEELMEKDKELADKIKGEKSKPMKRGQEKYPITVALPLILS